MTRTIATSLLATSAALLLFAACGDDDTTCGDGEIQETEVCDGAELDGETCVSQGFASGELACAAGCGAFDTSDCVPAECGDGAANGEEACDGSDFAGETCLGQGFDLGALACAADCTLDTTGCAYATCGDDTAEGTEPCDGADLQGQDCTDHGFLSGYLGCNATCDGFDTSGCDNTGATCGDGVLSPLFEHCDGDEMWSTDCADYHEFVSGSVTCGPNCVPDFSQCVGDYCESYDYTDDDCDLCGLYGGAEDTTCHVSCFIGDGHCGSWYYPEVGMSACMYLFGVEDPDCGVCGDGLINGPNEWCDGPDVQWASCVMLGYGGGTIACDGSCHFDLSGCTEPPTCGNDVIEPGEECDGTSPLWNCGEYSGYLPGGTPTCDANCQMNFSTCTPVTCGDGIKSSPEDCDGVVTSSSCKSHGYASGTLTCHPVTCTYDFSGCTPYVCGNGIVEEGEACDSWNLRGHDCESIRLGFSGGTLTCGTDCQLDTSGCTAPTCGDGARGGFEVCDGADLGPYNCVNIGHGFVGGTLACDASCQLDTSGCTPPTCGDGAIEGNEDCDGADLAGLSCPGLNPGFVGGTLACDPTSCRFDTSGCTAPTCGDGVVEGFEACDGNLLGGYNCWDDERYGGGTLACNTTCDWFDFSGCIPAQCGDNLQNGGELCDGSDLAWYDCSNIEMGFTGGTLACAPDCMGFNTSGCTGPTCGDGVRVWPEEQCDGTDPNPAWYPCSNVDNAFSGGTLVCNFNCTWDTSGCTLPTCGDGVAETIEVCDGADLRGNDCTTVGGGFGPGAVTCLPDCTGFDVSACPAPACGNGFVHGSEECDDGNLTPGDGCDANCLDEPTAIAAASNTITLVGSIDLTDPIWSRPSETCNLWDPYREHHYDVHVIENTSGASQTITLVGTWQPSEIGYLHIYPRPFHPYYHASCIAGANDGSNPAILSDHVMAPGDVLVIVVSASSQNDAIGPYDVEVYTH